MLHSHSHQERAFDFFASFLRNILDGDDRYKPLVEPVINETKSLVRKEKDYYEVDRTSYDIIIFLAEKEPSFFTNLDIEKLSPQDYSHILGLITAQKDLSIA